jgi:hypothetical protein
MTRFGDNTTDLFQYHLGILDHVHDRIQFYLKNHSNIVYVNNIDQIGKIANVVQTSNEEKIVCSQFVDCIPGDLAHWQHISELCVQHSKKLYLISNSFVSDFDFPNITHYTDPVWHGVFLVNDHRPLLANQQTKLFSCFIQRVESIRQSWLYFLHHHDLLDRGYVSFLFKQLPDYSNLSGVELYHWIHQNFNLGDLAHFEQAYQQLKNTIPYVNVDDVKDIQIYLENSKYGLCLDTYATCDHWIFKHATTQAMRILQFSCEPLLFLQQGTIKHIKQLGLIVPDYHDDIDNLSSWQQRQQAILSKLIADSTVESDLDRVRHNRNLFRHWQNTLLQSDHIESVIDFISKD